MTRLIVHLLRNFKAKTAVVPLLLAYCMISSAGCGKTVKEETESSEETPLPEEYHADDDIAMAVASITDALKVGERLDSAEYDYEGVLTDGQGSPLYTDVQGAPGLWEISVVSPNTAMIRNVFLGDLLPWDLESYLLDFLGKDPSEKLDFNVHEAVDDDETDISLYCSDGVFIRFEVRAGIAPNGIEGPLMSIVMSTEPPEGSEYKPAGSFEAG